MTQEEIKKLIERYPYLIPRNIFTDKIPDDYDFTYIKHLEIPRGWNKLFLQMCEDIRQPLIDAEYLEIFRFSQIKEKFNRLVCYNFGAPEEVHRIIDKYSKIAQYVCVKCGKPASVETQGYIASYCKDCMNDLPISEKTLAITFKLYYKVVRLGGGAKQELLVSIEDEWNRYLANTSDTLIDFDKEQYDGFED